MLVVPRQVAQTLDKTAPSVLQRFSLNLLDGKKDRQPCVIVFSALLPLSVLGTGISLAHALCNVLPHQGFGRYSYNDLSLPYHANTKIGRTRPQDMGRRGREHRQNKKSTQIQSYFGHRPGVRAEDYVVQEDGWWESCG